MFISGLLKRTLTGIRKLACEKWTSRHSIKSLKKVSEEWTLVNSIRSLAMTKVQLNVNNRRIEVGLILL